MKAAGTLKEPLFLLRPQENQLNDGTRTKSYQQVAMVWGQVSAAAGSEAFARDALITTHQLTITLRRRSDIRAGWRIERDGQSLRVKAVEPAPAHSPLMQVLCELEEEGSNGGA